MPLKRKLFRADVVSERIRSFIKNQNCDIGSIQCERCCSRHVDKLASIASLSIQSRPPPLPTPSTLFDRFTPME